MSASPKEPVVDPDELTAKIAHFEALELGDSVAFAEALVTNIMDPDPVETAAFRSNELAYKAYVAATYIIDNANSIKRRRRRGSQKQLATEAFIANVGRERRILKACADGLRAKQGILSASPNPTRRAQKRLWNLALRGQPVPADMIPDPRLAAQVGMALKQLSVALHDAEVQKDRDRKREQKKARQAARRAEQAQQRR